MTARLPEEPARVTNWLAGWLDYVCATLIAAGRWFRIPVGRGGEERVLMAAFAPTMDAYGTHWQDADEEAGSGRVVRLLEIGMLSVSFFLAAHLLSGGTPTVSAPDLNPFQVGNNRAQAASLTVPGTTGKEVIVNAGSFAPSVQSAVMEPSTPVDDAAAVAADVQAQTPETEEIAILAPASEPEADSAAVSPPAVETAPAPAASEQVAPPPAPAVTAPSAAAPAGEDRYLSSDELRAAAVAAGWPAELLPDLEAVAWCESRYHTHAQYLGALGLMQMMPLWFVDAGLDPDRWWDPVTNLRAAKHAYDTQIRLGVDGWGPWTCKP